MVLWSHERSTVVISTQQAEPLKAVRSKECAGYTGPEMTAPSMEEMNKLIVEDVIKETLKEITLKNGRSSEITHICTSILQASSSLVVPRVMQVSLAVRSLLTRMEVGELMVAAHSLARILLRWTALRLIFVGRWPSLL